MNGFDGHDAAADQRMAGSRGVLAWLPQVLLYPLRGHAPPIILLVTLMLGFGSGGLVGFPLLVVGMLFLAHYAIRVIEQTSLGHARPPRLGGDALMLADRFTWAAMLAPLALLSLHFRGADAAVIALALLLPAHWIALASTRSLVSALHPLRLMQIVVVTGPAYLAVCALALAAALAGRWLSAELSSLLLLAIWLYALFAACHLLGFVAYQRHERLGIGVQVERPAQQLERTQLEDQAQRIEQLVQVLSATQQAGDSEGAAKLLRDTQPGAADARQFHETLYERLKLAQLRGLALTQAARMIGFLLDRRLSDRALEIFENAADRDPRFQAESALHYPPLAERALETRQYTLLARLLDSAQAGFPGDPALRLLDLVRVRELFDHRRDAQAARTVLDALGPLDRHPQAAALGGYARALGAGRLRPEPQAAGGAANPQRRPDGE